MKLWCELNYFRIIYPTHIKILQIIRAILCRLQIWLKESLSRPLIILNNLNLKLKSENKLSGGNYEK